MNLKMVHEFEKMIVNLKYPEIQKRSRKTVHEFKTSRIPKTFMKNVQEFENGS